MPTGVTPATQRPPVAPIGAAPPAYTAQIVVDRQSVALTGAEGDIAAGQAAVVLPPPAAGYAFLVERIDLWSASTQATTASVYVGSIISPQNEMDFSSSANHDIADEHQPIYVPSEQPLTIVWSNMVAGSAAPVTARIQYTVIQFVRVNLPGSPA